MINDESFCKNPWVFNQDGTYFIMRDKKHGKWIVEDNSLLKMMPLTDKGILNFKVETLENNKVTIKCVDSTWDFLKSWKMKFVVQTQD